MLILHSTCKLMFSDGSFNWSHKVRETGFPVYYSLPYAILVAPKLFFIINNIMVYCILVAPKLISHY